ncbi:MAG: adenosine deaminase [Candidatus Marinimicrobia bacterium]|nr:adenosine deaminase [Candidatus Neomarinimicrobiota bacterium]
MKKNNTEITEELVRALPKTDLHCHLDGSLRVETLLELAHEQGVDLPADNVEELNNIIHAGSERNKSLAEYLKVFDYTLSVLQEAPALERVAFELAEDQWNDGVRLLEVRFSPVLNIEKGLTLAEIIEATKAGLKRAEAKYGIKTGIIVCGIRSIGAQTSLTLAELAVAFKNRGVVGYDLAGQEENFPAKDHMEAFYLTLNNNLNLTIHAGEAYGPESIHQAIHYCGAHRIGHGTRTREDGDLLNYINDHRIPLEMCITSNVQTGSVNSFETHPIRNYYDLGLRVTINTDNLLVSDTTITKEFLIAHKYYDFDLDDFKEMIIFGFKSAFLPYKEKRKLVKEVVEELAKF